MGMNLLNPDRVAKTLNAQLIEIGDDMVPYLPGHRTLRFDNGVPVLALGFAAVRDEQGFREKVYAEIETDLSHRSEWYDVESIHGDIIVPGWDLRMREPSGWTIFWTAEAADELEVEE